MTIRQTLGVLFARAGYILKTEGLIRLLKRGFTCLVPYFFKYGTVYLYEHTMKERNEADFVPEIQDFTFEIVSTNEQADELAAAGFTDFRLHFVKARRSLDKGAIAFCVFVEHEVAHITWAAMTEEAKNTIDRLPYQVSFSNKEACTGSTVTIPKYRGNGLMTYGCYKKFEFLREMGIMISRNAIRTSNIVSQRVHAKFGPEIYAEARYVRVIWWLFWKEMPLTETSPRD